MLDYRGIEALYTVIELQSFELAAKKLRITQSAISQRVKGLETYYGEPILIRILPYRPTKLGQQLIAHFKQISLLENDLQQIQERETHKLHISIALNRDSLETWFLDLIEDTALFNNITLEIIADDQELTLDYLRNGVVNACLSTSGKEIKGGKAQLLGTMEYLLAATPAFAKRYFSKKNPKECLMNAPAVKFDRNDKLHERYLEKFFSLDGRELTYFTMPSVRGFKKLITKGYAYGLIPRIEVEAELKKKQLVHLYSDKSWKIPLYWHSWTVDSQLYQKFNADLMRQVKKKMERLH